MGCAPGPAVRALGQACDSRIRVLAFGCDLPPIMSRISTANLSICPGVAHVYMYEKNPKKFGKKCLKIGKSRSFPSNDFLQLPSIFSENRKPKVEITPLQ